MSSSAAATVASTNSATGSSSGESINRASNERAWQTHFEKRDQARCDDWGHGCATANCRMRSASRTARSARLMAGPMKSVLLSTSMHIFPRMAPPSMVMPPSTTGTSAATAKSLSGRRAGSSPSHAGAHTKHLCGRRQCPTAARQATRFGKCLKKREARVTPHARGCARLRSHRGIPGPRRRRPKGHLPALTYPTPGRRRAPRRPSGRRAPRRPLRVPSRRRAPRRPQRPRPPRAPDRPVRAAGHAPTPWGRRQE